MNEMGEIKKEMGLVSCGQCGLVYNKNHVSEWDGSVIDAKGKLKQLKCKVCNTYTTIEG